MADAAMHRWPNGRFDLRGKRDYELGALLEGMDAAWYNTADGRYYEYIKSSMDSLVMADGSIESEEQNSYSRDNALLGSQLLLLYGVTQDKKYYEAATRLAQQVAAQTSLDGLYETGPFLAQYAATFHEPREFARITRQFMRTDQRGRDQKAGLLSSGGDGAKLGTRWMGRYMMALVDTIPFYPENDPGRALLIGRLRRTAAAALRYQDAESGLWREVFERPAGKGNPFESSASCMLTYALAKGSRLGYLPKEDAAHATAAWKGILHGAGSELMLDGTAQAMGQGGAHRLETSYSGTPSTKNDPEDIGAFLLAASEEEMAHSLEGIGSAVQLDAWYNSQTRKNAAGQTVLFHYKWDDYADSGFSILGHIFRSYGVTTKELTTAPTVALLQGSRFYMIVSPDNLAKNPSPHFMNTQDAAQIAEWVKRGGVLILMENDPANADITHLDLLADRFGLHFNNVLVHHVEGRNYSMGRIDVPKSAPPFTHSHVLFMKDICSLTLSRGATSLLIWKGDVLMAKAHYGRGTVFAVADPWLYNEYTDGRIPPPEFDNFAAGQELVGWLLQQR